MSRLVPIINIAFTTIFTGLSGEVLSDYGPNSTNQPFRQKEVNRKKRTACLFQTWSKLDETNDAVANVSLRILTAIMAQIFSC